MATIDDVVVAFNGDLFVANDIGEADIGNPGNVVTLYTNGPAMHGGGRNAITVNEQLRMMAQEIDLQIVNGAPPMNDRQKNEVLACRLGAWKLDLLKPDDAPNAHHCHYNEAVRVVDMAADPAAPGWFQPALVKELSLQMTNIVSFCAYIFRWRGHHFKPDYVDDLEKKWAKNLNARIGLILREDWEFILTRGLHAIFPDVLDKFWLDAIAAGECCNPFALRGKVPAAGTAGFFAMAAGVKEAILVFPEAMTRVKPDVDRLVALCADLQANRWKGAVNRVYYGGDVNTVNEGAFSALAALISGMNTPEDNVTDLGKSESLTRISKNAPLSKKIIQSTTSGILKMCMSGETQALLGNNALKRLVFSAEEK